MLPRSDQASAELLLAQQEAEFDANEIRNSSRIQLQSMESRYAADVDELNLERRRLISDHMQRTDALTHKLHCAANAENSAGHTAKANAEEARLVAAAQGVQAAEAINHIKGAVTQ